MTYRIYADDSYELFRRNRREAEHLAKRRSLKVAPMAVYVISQNDGIFGQISYWSKFVQGKKKIL
jgi:hypothetical protein